MQPWRLLCSGVCGSTCLALPVACCCASLSACCSQTNPQVVEASDVIVDPHACHRSHHSFPPCTLQVVEASDVIIEVLDARDPLGCRCADVERFVRRTDPSKKIILLLNKIGGLLGIVAVVFLSGTGRCACEVELRSCFVCSLALH